MSATPSSAPPAGVDPIRTALAAWITGAASGGAAVALGLYAAWGLERRAEHLMGLALAGLAVALGLAFVRTRGFAAHHRAIVLALAGVGTVLLGMLTIPANQFAPRTGLAGLAGACAAAAVIAELWIRPRGGAR